MCKSRLVWPLQKMLGPHPLAFSFTEMPQVPSNKLLHVKQVLPDGKRK